MQQSAVIYGIANCDTVKKARNWLATNQIDVKFYDFKKQPLTTALLANFLAHKSWDELLNKRSTSYRNLPDEVKNNLTDEILTEQVLALPTLLKRPLLIHNNQLHLGFKPEQYQAIFNE